LNLLEAIKNPSTAIDWVKLRVILDHELEWHAKILVLRIILSTNWRGKPQENIQTNQYISSEISHDKNLFRTLLASDLRFLTLFKFVKKEFVEGYKEISSSHRDHTVPS
jgi:hypothetical protein